MVLIQTREDGIKKLLAEEFTDSAVDLVVEGGTGNAMCPLMWVRDRGYTGPYVRMDLHPDFSGIIDSGPQSWTDTDDNQKYENFWNVHGNCFNYDLLQAIVRKFNSKKPAFITHGALANALFDNHIEHGLLKNDEDRELVPEAVDVLSRVYVKQLHEHPAGFAYVLSAQAYEAHKEDFKDIPAVTPQPNLVVFDPYGVDIVHHIHYFVFKWFMEESEKRGWKSYMLQDRENVLFMTKSS